MLDSAYTNRHDVLASQEDIIAANYSKKQTVSTYLPTVNFVATYSRNFEADDVNLSSGSYSKEDVQDMFSYGLEFSWNLLDWGVRQSQISAAVSKEESAKLTLDQLKSNVKIDVTNSYLNLDEAVQVLETSKVSVQFARDAYSQRKAQFDAGQATTTDLIAAYTSEVSALASLANARGALDLSWLNLQKTSGMKITTLSQN